LLAAKSTIMWKSCLEPVKAGMLRHNPTGSAWHRYFDCMAYMKRLIFLLLLAATLLVACGGEQKHVSVAPGATVLVLGDSVSYGTGAGKGEDYPTLLAGNTGWNVINAGVPGDTTADGLERLPSLLEEHSPQLLLVELGGNDFLRHVPLTQTASNLKAILSQARAKGVPTVLLAVPRPNVFGALMRSLSDDPLFKKIAGETNTPIVENVLSEVLSKNALKSDAIHPDAKGYRKVEEGLRKSLRELGFLK
jgi:acyl-CoA thioesterase-1